METTNVLVCRFIRDNWMKEDSNRSFAIEHDIDEKTARNIRNIDEANFSPTLETLEKVCISRNLTLEAFFGLIKR